MELLFIENHFQVIQMEAEHRPLPIDFGATFVPRLNCGQAAKSVRCRKPDGLIQDPSHQKIAEDSLHKSHD